MISVIIPTHNRERTIYDSAMSVLNQTITDLELIIVDDGSTDNTEEVVSMIDDHRLIYIKEEVNRGACAARNTGIQRAKGDFIAFQDSDDIWKNEKLEKQLSFLTNTSADLVYCGMTRTVKEKTKYFPQNQRDDEKLTLVSLLSRNKVSTQTILCKKEIAKEVLFDESLKRLQDWDFVIRVLLSRYTVEYLPLSLVETQVQHDSITSLVSSEESYKKILSKYNEQYLKYPKALGQVYATIASNIKHEDRKKSNKYLLKSMQYNFKIITLLKLVLNTLCIW